MVYRAGSCRLQQSRGGGAVGSVHGAAAAAPCARGLAAGEARGHGDRAAGEVCHARRPAPHAAINSSRQSGWGTVAGMSFTQQHGILCMASAIDGLLRRSSAETCCCSLWYAIPGMHISAMLRRALTRQASFYNQQLTYHVSRRLLRPAHTTFSGVLVSMAAAPTSSAGCSCGCARSSCTVLLRTQPGRTGRSARLSRAAVRVSGEQWPPVERLQGRGRAWAGLLQQLACHTALQQGRTGTDRNTEYSGEVFGWIRSASFGLALRRLA